MFHVRQKWEEWENLYRSFLQVPLGTDSDYRRSQGGGKGAIPPKKVLEYLVILCFKRRYLIKNSVPSLKSSVLPPKNILGWLRN